MANFQPRIPPQARLEAVTGEFPKGARRFAHLMSSPPDLIRGCPVEVFVHQLRVVIGPQDHLRSSWPGLADLVLVVHRLPRRAGSRLVPL